MLAAALLLAAFRPPAIGPLKTRAPCCAMSEAERRLLTAAEETSQDEIIISPHRGQEEDGGVPTPLQHAMTVEVLTQDDHVDYANLLTPCEAPPNDSGHAGRGDELAEQQHRVEELEAILGALEGKVAEALALLELTEQEAQIAVTRASLRASESYRAQRGLELALACAEKRVAGSGGDDDNGVTPLQAVRRLASRLLPGRGLASWRARKAAATATATATAAAAAAATDEGADPATGGAGSSDATPPNRLANQMYHTQLRRLREGGRHAAASAGQRAAAARGGGPSHSVSSSLVQATAAARRVEADRAAAKADDAWRSAVRARTLVSQLSKATEAAVAARDEAAAELSLARAALYDETSHGTSIEQDQPPPPPLAEPPFPWAGGRKRRQRPPRDGAAVERGGRGGGGRDRRILLGRPARPPPSRPRLAARRAAAARGASGPQGGPRGGGGGAGQRVARGGLRAVRPPPPAPANV